MGIQGIIGDVSSSIGNAMKNIFENAGNVLTNIASGIGTFVADVWDGGFVGVSDFEALKAAITEYSNRTKTMIDEYNANADLDQALKGEAAAALQEFIVQTKALLEAYVALVEKWNAELDEYLTNYSQGDTNLASNVSEDAAKVAAEAQNVDIG